MRRVWIIGISGSGKTTLAAELARRLGVPHIELDAMHHGPDWAEPDPEQFRADVASVVAGDGWVVDGGYQRKLGTMVPEAADTLIWLDLPLHVSMLRTIRRSLGRVLRRAELWNGNRETLRGLCWGRESLLGWSVTQHRDIRALAAGAVRVARVRVRADPAPALRQVRAGVAGDRPQMNR